MRVSKRPKERRAELIAAARELFDKQGVDKTRVSDIVHRVGVAQGVFYYYFASKEEMVETVVRQVAGEVEEKARTIVSDELLDYYKKLSLFIELILEIVDTFLGDEETHLQPLQAGGEINGLSGQAMSTLTSYLRKLVEEGAKSGKISAEYPWQTVRVLLAGMRRLAEEQLPPRPMIYTMCEQALVLPKDSLMQYLTLEQRKGE